MRNIIRISGIGKLLFIMLLPIFLSMFACGGGGGGESTSGTATPSGSTTISKTYIQGDMAGNPVFYVKMSESVAKTSGALLQSILTVNSFLFTDCTATDIETFKARKIEADKALDTLVKYAEEAEIIITASEPKRIAKAQPLTAASEPKMAKAEQLKPEDVLATVASGPSNAQIKTLMTSYKVNAKAAKEILDSAMTGLISSYDKEAEFYNKAALTASMVKESAALGFTVASTIVTAGGVSGALTVGQAACAIISGADGAIKVAKSGLELAVGKEITLPDGTKASMLITGVSTVSDIIAFKDFGKLLDPLATADNIGNVYTISSKIVDGFADKTISLGGVKVDISDGLSIGSTVDVGYINNTIGGIVDAPSTLPGTYKINGVAKVVGTLPDTMTKAVTILPVADKVDVAIISGTSTANNPVVAKGTFSGDYAGDLTLRFKAALGSSVTGSMVAPEGTISINGTVVAGSTVSASLSGYAQYDVLNVDGGWTTASCTVSGSLSGTLGNHQASGTYSGKCSGSEGSGTWSVTW